MTIKATKSIAIPSISGVQSHSGMDQYQLHNRGKLSSSRMYKMLDLFCGTGALSHGLEAASDRLKTAAGIDADKSAVQTSALNHPDARIFCEKIEHLSPDKMLELSRLGSIDVIVGGPPCQGFSSLRPSRGAGLHDPRNFLYKEFVRYVQKLRPRIFLLENVVGILTASDGKLVTEMLSEFTGAGYEVDWRVLNAANFGVPQKRERFFLMGLQKALGSKLRPEFPVPTHWFRGKVIGTRLKNKYIINQDFGMPPVNVWEAISDLPSLMSGQSSTSYRDVEPTIYQADRRRGNGRTLTLHEAASHNARILEVIRHSGSSINALPNGLVSSGYSSCYSRLPLDEPATTITVKFTSPASSKCIHPIDNRSITPREAARLQSFDDSYRFSGSKTDIACQIGNAVPPLLGRAFAPIIERLLDAQGMGEI